VLMVMLQFSSCARELKVTVKRTITKKDRM
jgi:hypothetical protein